MYDISNTREAIAELQTYLLEIAYSAPGIPKLVPDGDFSRGTAEAVIAFQSGAGLSPTGIVDYETWTLIARDYIRIKGERDLKNDPTLPIDLPLSTGSVGPSVLILQSDINQLGEIYRDLPSLAPSGVYRSGTSYAVGLLQRRYGLLQTGVTDHVTRKRIAEDVRTRGKISEETNH